jgi:hypothetical protein
MLFLEGAFAIIYIHHYYFILLYMQLTHITKVSTYGILMECLSCAFNIFISCNHHVSYLTFGLSDIVEFHFQICF